MGWPSDLARGTISAISACSTTRPGSRRPPSSTPRRSPPSAATACWSSRRVEKRIKVIERIAMSTEQGYDVVVIGGGPGGYVAAIRAAQLGLRTAVVERESLGGICLNWGCIPTKALLKSAQVFQDILHAKDFGIEASGTPDFPAVIKRSRGVADKMSKGVQFLMRKNKIDVVMGNGKLKAKGQLEVTGADGKTQIVEGKHIIVATGARSKELPNLKQDGKKVIGYREAMVLPQNPKSIIVVGSGAIGVEFAYFYFSMGAKVTIVEFLPRIVPVEDEEISKELEKNYKKLG